MTDHMQYVPPAIQTVYPRCGLRIAATYAATDGSCPESIEVEFGEVSDLDISSQAIMNIIGALSMAASSRYGLIPDHPLLRNTSLSESSAAPRQS